MINNLASLKIINKLEIIIKMDQRTSQIIIANFFVSKNLKTRPAHAIKFIMINKEYFPTINTQLLEQIMKEHNITQEMLDLITDIQKLESIDNNLEQNARRALEEKEKLRLEKLAQEFARIY